MARLTVCDICGRKLTFERVYIDKAVLITFDADNDEEVSGVDVCLDCARTMNLTQIIEKVYKDA